MFVQLPVDYKVHVLVHTTAPISLGWCLDDGGSKAFKAPLDAGGGRLIDAV